MRKNTQITEDMLEIKQMPKQAVTKNTVTDKKQIVGKVSMFSCCRRITFVMQKFTDVGTETDKAFYMKWIIPEQLGNIRNACESLHRACRAKYSPVMLFRSMDL